MPPNGVKRPRDSVQLAATIIIGLATGQITEGDVEADRAPKRCAGGLKGGKARAHAGVQTRWGGKAR